ncbi:MAG TPA: hypothetical protein VMT56_03100 [Candidatus Bathyarchaeia archaeon]|nr:hypothetical protein [Candidatus Bathyarchaeia archaeon]
MTNTILKSVYPTRLNDVTAGWATKPAGAYNRDKTLDPRLAGTNSVTNGKQDAFYVDLPSPGTYNVSLAMGDAGAAACQSTYCQVQFMDGNTTLATVKVTGFGKGYFADATGTARSSTGWPANNAARQLSISGTRLTVLVGTTSTGGTTPISHIAVASAVGNFSMAASPTTLNLIQGSAGTSTVTTTVSNGFNSNITLSASGVPSGTTVTFSPQTIGAPGAGSSTMTVAVGTSTAAGTYPITVTGSGGGIKRTTTVTLAVQSAPDFSITASPSALTVSQGGQGSSTITTSTNEGFNGSITLSASGVPSGTTVTFSPQTIPAPGSGSSAMTITVGTGTAAGTYPMTVTGSGGGTQHTTTVTLTVSRSADFTISASPSILSISQGNQGSSTLTTSISGGFNSSIVLSASGLPSGTTVGFSPQTIVAPGSGSSTMTLTVGTETAAGTYPITVTATGGGITHTASVILMVTSSSGQSDFAISVAQNSVFLTPGNQGQTTLLSAVTGGFNSAVSLTAVGVPPGANVTFSPSTIAAPGNGTSTVTVDASSSAPTGAYLIKLTAIGGGLQRTTNMLLLVRSASLAAAPLPNPPRVYVDTTWNPPTGGNVWAAHDSAAFASALLSSQPGDTIVLDAGTVYSGNFKLPAKTNPDGQWIYVISSGLANLPPPGTRVSPSDAASMATIATPNASPAMLLDYGSNHFRFVGVEFTSMSNYGCNPTSNPPQACFSYYLISGRTSNDGKPDNLADSITVDRCYLHGTSNGANSQDVNHAIGANATNFALIDSYISDIHYSTFDSQAVLAFYTPGPIKIVNNFLSATTEDVMFGGAGGYNNPYLPSDIEIRANHFYKDPAWDSCGTGGTIRPGGALPSGALCPSGPGAPNAQWSEKNNLEFKSVQRVLVSGNTLENTWVAGQNGYSVLLTPRTSQSGNIAVVDDVIFDSNILTHVTGGINTSESDYDCGPTQGYPKCTNPGEQRRVWINNNLILLSPALDTYQHVGLQVGTGMADFVFQHNTELMNDYSTLWSSIFFGGGNNGCPPQTSTQNFWVLDNALTRQPNGDCFNPSSSGIPMLSHLMALPASPTIADRFYGNAMAAPGSDTVQTWPGSSNLATKSPFVYADPANGNYELLSPSWTNTTDGAIPGINWNTLQLAMNP